MPIKWGKWLAKTLKDSTSNTLGGLTYCSAQINILKNNLYEKNQYIMNLHISQTNVFNMISLRKI